MQRQYNQDQSPLPDPAFQPGFYDGVLAKRLVAWLMDAALVGGMVLAVILMTAFIGLFFLPVLWAVIDFFYRATTLANRSATFGMRVMGIEFRDRYGQHFDGATAMVHTAGYLVSMSITPLQVVSVVLMLTSARAQGLTDHVLGTAAINRPAMTV